MCEYICTDHEFEEREKRDECHEIVAKKGYKCGAFYRTFYDGIDPIREIVTKSCVRKEHCEKE